jgi:hypothetical protein
VEAELRKGDADFAAFGYDFGTSLPDLIFDPAFCHGIRDRFKPLRSLLSGH